MLKNNKKLHENEFNDQKKEDENNTKESNNNNEKKLLKRVEIKGINIIELKEEKYESEK